ncbi:predicted protein [Streptomyces iranensis]|uniref:Uncharacterized protein n=1 Tax=Streptomyces iranensis TaxID=576784 RepID=A0A060ZTC9_9ACTN|nr:hypothetical protein [Streptomyces iranensis]CDR06591.1 predicted protein [Streptomyces iranensis]
MPNRRRPALLTLLAAALGGAVRALVSWLLSQTD